MMDQLMVAYLFYWLPALPMVQKRTVPGRTRIMKMKKPVRI
jgi:hypothetical protein